MEEAKDRENVLETFMVKNRESDLDGLWRWLIFVASQIRGLA